MAVPKPNQGAKLIQDVEKALCSLKVYVDELEHNSLSSSPHSNNGFKEHNSINDSTNESTNEVTTSAKTRACSPPKRPPPSSSIISSKPHLLLPPTQTPPRRPATPPFASHSPPKTTQMQKQEAKHTLDKNTEFMFLNRVIPKTGPILVNLIGVPTYGSGWRIGWINGKKISLFQNADREFQLHKLLETAQEVRFSSLANFCSKTEFQFRMESTSLLTFPHANHGSRSGFAVIETQSAHQKEDDTYTYAQTGNANLAPNIWCLTADFRFP